MANEIKFIVECQRKEWTNKNRSTILRRKTFCGIRYSLVMSFSFSLAQSCVVFLWGFNAAHRAFWHSFWNCHVCGFCLFGSVRFSRFPTLLFSSLFSVLLLMLFNFVPSSSSSSFCCCRRRRHVLCCPFNAYGSVQNTILSLSICVYLSFSLSPSLRSALLYLFAMFMCLTLCPVTQTKIPQMQTQHE